MNRNYALTIGTIAFAILFYQQKLGLNLLLFNLLLTSYTIYEYRPKINNFNFWASVAAVLITGFSSAWFGDALSIISNIMSLVFLSLFAQHPNSSIFLSVTQGFYSFFASPIYTIKSFFKKESSSKEKKSNVFLIKILAMFVVPVSVLLIFLRLYMSANPIFEKMVVDLNLDFLSMGFLFFTIWGAFLVFNFLNFRKETTFSKIDNSFKEDLEIRTPSPTFRNLSVRQEISSGIVLFGLLNALLIVVLFADFQHLILDTVLPEGITYSKFVHQGIGAVITSIVFAVLLIVFYFKGSLNFASKAKALRVLSVVWITLNVLLVISTAMKNDMYIDSYDLTFKRIGVYVYLLLACIGLAITFFKIVYKKSNWLLVKKGYWAFFFVLVFSTPVNWSKIVTVYNIKLSQEKDIELDIDYLLELPEYNIAALLPLMEINFDSTSSDYLEKNLSEKFYKFIIKHRNKDFRSLTLKNQHNLKILENSKPLFEVLYLKNNFIGKIEFISLFADIKTLNLSQVIIFNWSNLEQYSKLETLNISNNTINSLSEIKLPKNLTKLDLRGNYFENFDGLKNLSTLKHLDVSYNTIKNFKGSENLSNLEYLDISYNPIENLKGIENLSKLKSLDISCHYSENLKNLKGIEKLHNLEYLHLTGDNIKNYSPLYNLKKIKNIKIFYSYEDAKAESYSVIEELKRKFPNKLTINVRQQKYSR